MMLAGTDVPIVPCYLDGCFEALRPETKWPLRRPITIHIGKPLRFDTVPNKRAGWEQIAVDLQAAVKALGPAGKAESRPSGAQMLNAPMKSLHD
jgi:1-acyl-sn-glycerol-3-phosphate acyltransferase